METVINAVLGYLLFVVTLPLVIVGMIAIGGAIYAANVVLMLGLQWVLDAIESYRTQ